MTVSLVNGVSPSGHTDAVKEISLLYNRRLYGDVCEGYLLCGLCGKLRVDLKGHIVVFNVNYHICNSLVLEGYFDSVALCFKLGCRNNRALCVCLV